MKNKILLTVIINTLLAIVFVSLTIWAFNTGLEETFVTLALLYSFVTVVGNALLTAFFEKTKK